MSYQEIKESFEKLKAYCEQEEFRGWDPFDGLNSRLFNALPGIRSNRFSRLAWIQFFKRSPFNFRRIAGVKKEYNTKGLGLFLTGYCNLYQQQPLEEYKQQIYFLGNKLIELQTPGFSGSCWGYNFDWQARAFFQPKNTPTVVATSFVADALWNAYDCTGEQKFLDAALSSTAFIQKDLYRTYDEKGNFSFSYSPVDKTQVFNASLLGAKLLSRAYRYHADESFRNDAKKAVAYVCDRQQSNGAWAYGTLPFHQWIDNFHTGFNLECIHKYQRYTGDYSFDEAIKKGTEFYLDHFFMPDGASKYYHDKLYPVDVHSPAQLIITMDELGFLQQQAPLVEKVLDWTIQHMQDSKGYFYYQVKKGFSSRIPYMRWAQAWMFYAMSYYLKQKD
jgi:hypothetical protein